MRIEQFLWILRPFLFSNLLNFLALASIETRNSFVEYRKLILLTLFALLIYFFFLFKLHRIILLFIFNSIYRVLYFKLKCISIVALPFYLFRYLSFISFSIFIPRCMDILMYLTYVIHVSVIFLFPFYPIFSYSILSFFYSIFFFKMNSSQSSVITFYFDSSFSFSIIFACLTSICPYVSSTITSQFSLFHLLFRIIMLIRCNLHLILIKQLRESNIFWESYRKYTFQNIKMRKTFADNKKF